MTLISVLGHKRYHIDIHIALGKYQNLQGSLLAVGIRCEHSLELLPIAVAYVEGCFGQQFGILWWPALGGLNQYHAYLLGIAFYVAHKGREIVLLASLN